MRRIELVNLKKEDIFNQYIKINNWKWNKDRIIYITKEFSKFIQDYINIQKKNNDYLFCDYQWKQLDRNALSKIFTRIKKKTNIYLSPHLVRHTYASLCVKKWINLYTTTIMTYRYKNYIYLFIS
jgi:integrase/recombinase XerD